MEYAILGSVLSVLISMKFTDFTSKKHNVEYVALVEKVEKLEAYSEKHDKEILRNVMTTVAPIATAVQKLNTEVGIR